MAADRRAPGPGNRPFEALARRRRTHPKPPSQTAPPASPAPPSEPRPADDAELFSSAMTGVAPLSPAARACVPGPTPSTAADRARTHDDSEALAVLSDLVAGEIRFDVTDTVEHVEGAIVGLDQRLARRLRRGDFACEAHLDLHGMTTAPAREAVRRLLRQSFGFGHRCVLIVHGRGLRSKDGEPVLKRQLVSWLSDGTMARMVLAFCSARPRDGGAGALYVLLRRDRKKRPVRATTGTTSD